MENVYRFYYLDSCYAVETKDALGKKIILTFRFFDEIQRMIQEQPLGVVWYQVERWMFGDHVMLFKSAEERMQFESSFVEEVDYQEKDSISTIDDIYTLKTTEDFMQEEMTEDPSLFKSVGTFSYQDNIVTFPNMKERNKFIHNLEKDFVLKRKIS